MNLFRYFGKNDVFSVVADSVHTFYRPLSCRQDVAYQMRTKTKEECESHYMKNFINNPLFSSTLLSMKKTKDSRFAEGAIPFKREYSHVFHHC